MSFKRAKQKVCHLWLIQNSFPRYPPCAYPKTLRNILSVAEYIQITYTRGAWEDEIQMEGFFLHRKQGPNLNVLQTGTATRGQCQFAVGEPRHIFLHIFLLRLPSCCLSCVHSAQNLSYSYLPGLQRAPRDGAFHSAGRDPGAVSWGSSMNRTCVYPLGCAASSCSY